MARDGGHEIKKTKKKSSTITTTRTSCSTILLLSRRHKILLALFCVALTTGIVTIGVGTQKAQESMIQSKQAVEMLEFLHKNPNPTTIPNSFPVSAISNNNDNKRLLEHRNCTNPEYGRVGFPLYASSSSSLENFDFVQGKSFSTGITCGIYSGGDRSNKFIKHLQELSQQIQKYGQKHCQEMVVFGAAFGEYHFTHYIWRWGQFKRQRQEFSCHFAFVLDTSLQQLPRLQSRLNRNKKANFVGLFPYSVLLANTRGKLLVGVRSADLPYQNLRRNVKLFKLNAHLLFPWAQRVLWMDAKLEYKLGQVRLAGNAYDASDLRRYFRNRVERFNVCGSVVSLPWHPSTVGISYYTKPNEEETIHIHRQQRFLLHCQTIQNSFLHRPNVSDSLSAVARQCDWYRHQVATANDGNHESSILDMALIDSAILAWDLRLPHCKAFVANLMCTWLDELHCHSDRDQLSFPYALHRMGLVPRHSYNETLIEEPQNQQLERDENTGNRLVHQIYANGSNLDTHLLLVVDSQCHWYQGEKALFTCRPGNATRSSSKRNKDRGRKFNSEFLPKKNPSWFVESKRIFMRNAKQLGIVPKTEKAPTREDNKENNKQQELHKHLAAQRICNSPEFDPEKQHPMSGCPKPVGVSHVIHNGNPSQQQVPKTTDTTCGLCGQSVFAQHLQDLAEQIQQALQEKCQSELVVFGVAFFTETEKEQFSQYVRVEERDEYDGIPYAPCHFMFELEETLRPLFNGTGRDSESPHVGLQSLSDPKIRSYTKGKQLVGVRRSALPYQSLRRNVKLFKMNAHLLFAWAPQVVWLDAKMDYWLDYRPGSKDLKENFYDKHVLGQGVCGAMVSLPAWHKWTTGKKPKPLRGAGQDKLSSENEKFMAHCQTILNSFEDRPTVSDSKDALGSQCEYYLNHVQQQQQQQPAVVANPSPLDTALIDSAILAWDLRTEACRKFVADLSCTWLDEIHCFSDRDQISFPHALYQMKLAFNARSGTFDDEQGQRMLHLTPGRCHWYHGRSNLFKCRHGAANLSTN